MSDVTPEPSSARKAATDCGYGVAILLALLLLVLMLARIIPSDVVWVAYIPPIMGLIVYYGVWKGLEVLTNE